MVTVKYQCLLYCSDTYPQYTWKHNSNTAS